MTAEGSPVVTFDAAALKEAMAATAKPVPGAQLTMALNRVQSRIRSVGKDRDVEVKSEKGRYTFRYATLSAIWEVIREPCAENGLAIVQLPTVDSARRMAVVETRILHTSGEWLSCSVELPLVRTDPQGIGAVISYARRYGLSSLLGVTQTDENDEEALEEMRHQPPPQSTQRPSPAGAKAPAPKASPPKAAAKSDGAPVEVGDLRLHLENCANKGELAKVAVKIKAAFDAKSITEQERAELLAVYQTQSQKISGGGQ